jgi:hypothetical protein
MTGGERALIGCSLELQLPYLQILPKGQASAVPQLPYGSFFVPFAILDLSHALFGDVENIRDILHGLATPVRDIQGACFRQRKDKIHNLIIGFIKNLREKPYHVVPATNPGTRPFTIPTILPLAAKLPFEI